MSRSLAARAIVTLVLVGTIVSVLFFGPPELVARLAAIMTGWALSFGAVRLLPAPGPTVAVGAAVVLFAVAVCVAFLDIRGDLPQWELAGGSVWLLLFRAASWYGVGAFTARLGGRSPNRPS